MTKIFGNELSWNHQPKCGKHGVFYREKFHRDPHGRRLDEEKAAKGDS